MKLLLCTLAAIVLVGAFTVHPADAACWWTYWGWRCGPGPYIGMPIMAIRGAGVGTPTGITGAIGTAGRPHFGLVAEGWNSSSPSSR
jgi:hypothetical protein